MMTALLRRTRVAPRIWFLLMLALLGFVTSAVIAVQMLERTLLGERQQSAEQTVAAAAAVAERNYRQSQEGILSETDAQQRTLSALRAMRVPYGEDNFDAEPAGFVWVSTLEHRMLIQPVRPTLEGKDLEATEDSERARLVGPAVKVARREGSGNVQHIWPMPGEEEPIERLSHVRHFEPWGWVIGSGVNREQIQSAVAQYMRTSSIEMLTLALILMAAGAIVIRSITAPLRRVVHTLNRYPVEPKRALSDLESDGRDEIAMVAQTIKHFGDLPNRQFLTDHLTTQLEYAKAQALTVSIILFDIDRFSDVNKILGEEGADEVLVRVEERIQTQVGKSIVTGRFAGDEFLAVLLDQDHESAISLAQDALNAIEEPIHVEGQEVVVTARAGIAQYPQDGERPGKLFNAADQAKRRAKETGAGTELFAEELHHQLIERLEVARDLRLAIRNDELELAWQTQVALPSEQIRGAEALLRWTRADGTKVSPGMFVPVAEQSGLIRPLGDWVIERVCQEASELQNHLPGNAIFALNLSPLQIHPSTCAQILEAAECYGVDPRRLEVEITETSMSDATGGLLILLGELATHGIRVAIDDFGTGYSNVASIKDLPVNQIKLDRSFVASLADDPDACEIASAVIAMTHAMRLELLAEGIETREQAAILEGLGCDAGQGFLYARPVSAEQLKAG